MGPPRRAPAADPAADRGRGRLQGVVDLVTHRALVWNDELGTEWEEQEIPADMTDEAHEQRTHLIEACADYDDELMEAYLAEEDISPERIKKALRQATLDIKVTPVLCGSSFKNKGVQPLPGRRDRLPPVPARRSPADGRRTSEGRRQWPSRRAAANIGACGASPSRSWPIRMSGS